MTDLAKLKALAEAATPGRVHDRLDSCGGGLKYECCGDDGSLVLKVDHKNDEWGFVGDKGEADEAFFLACTPAAVLALIAENEKLKADLRDAKDAALGLRWAVGEFKAECEGLRKDAERWRFVRNPVATGSPFGIWSERTYLFLGRFADEAIDDAMATEPDQQPPKSLT